MSVEQQEQWAADQNRLGFSQVVGMFMTCCTWQIEPMKSLPTPK